MRSIIKMAMSLANRLRELGFTILGKPDGIHGIPVVAFQLDPKRNLEYDEFDLSSELEKRGWLVPAYRMADGAQGTKLLRVVCRVDFTEELCTRLVHDVEQAAMNLGTESRCGRRNSISRLN